MFCLKHALPEIIHLYCIYKQYIVNIYSIGARIKTRINAILNREGKKQLRVTKTQLRVTGYEKKQLRVAGYELRVKAKSKKAKTWASGGCEVMVIVSVGNEPVSAASKIEAPAAG
jgi:hypothetical protein